MNPESEEMTEESGFGSLIDGKMPELESAASRIAEHVRAHPLPYSLVGAGLALVAIRALTRRDPSEGTATHVVRKAESRARETLEHWADCAGDAKEKVVRTATRANRNVTEFAEKNPLLVGAGILTARFLTELLVKRKSPAQAAHSMEAGDDFRRTLREFLRSVLDEPS